MSVKIRTASIVHLNVMQITDTRRLFLDGKREKKLDGRVKLGNLAITLEDILEKLGVLHVKNVDGIKRTPLMVTP